MHLEVLRTTEALQALTEEWNRLLAQSITPVPFLRHEYLSAWWSTRGGGEWSQGELRVVTARQADGNLSAIAPMFLTQNRDGLDALMLLGSIEISDYLDVIARPQELSSFFPALLEFLDGSLGAEWQMLDWYNLLEGTPSLEALRQAAEARGWSYQRECLQTAPYVPLPGDWEIYLSGLDKKQRHEVRRKLRRAENGPVLVRWYTVSQVDDLEREMQAFFDLMAQEPSKQAFLTDGMRSQMRATMQAAYRENWLQLAFLEIGGEKAAGYLNFDFGNQIWVYNSGIDARFRDFSPGWVLLAQLLRWGNEQKRACLDFLRGAEEYKYRLGGLDRYVVRVRVSR
ncbi:MAG TPA: GNAT family N-acetyltransferase [Anaerolineales bacterium]|nr:GNAT family N-acetyltransferase [Anaerolineales bacterium]